jgi:hypothetical protein
MSTPAEKAAAYLSRLEADRSAAIAVSEAKAEEAKLIKARQEGLEKPWRFWNCRLLQETLKQNL